jgi:signal transduction histidine kinase
MDGFVVCAKLRELPGGAETPIVFLTALRDVDTFDRALRAGGDDFLTKPVRPTELVVRVQAALKLRRIGAELREQVDLVRQQRDDMMRLQLQKEALTAFVVHDLKNPVNAIDLNAQLIARRKDLPAAAQNAVSQIRDEVRALMRLILNLLDISKAEEGRLTPRLQEVDLGDLVAEVASALKVRAGNKSVEIATRVQATTVAADPDLLRRVLENLVDNAIRHTPEESAVTISTAERDALVEIRVSDLGTGIPHAERERVFDRFTRLEQSSRTGHGLGLAFCKLAIDAMGGQIDTEDSDTGATFRVSLARTQGAT